MRPLLATELEPEPTEVPSTVPLIEVPLTVRLSVYQVLVATVRVAVPSTVTLPLFTACSCTEPDSSARR